MARNPKTKLNGSPAKRYYCPSPDCDKWVSRPHDMKRHTESHHNPNALVYPCPSCPFINTQKSNTLRHMRIKHGFDNQGKNIDITPFYPRAGLNRAAATSHSAPDLTFPPDPSTGREELPVSFTAAPDLQSPSVGSKHTTYANTYVPSMGNVAYAQVPPMGYAQAPIQQYPTSVPFEYTPVDYSNHGVDYYPMNEEQYPQQATPVYPQSTLATPAQQGATSMIPFEYTNMDIPVAYDSVEADQYQQIPPAANATHSGPNASTYTYLNDGMGILQFSSFDAEQYEQIPPAMETTTASLSDPKPSPYTYVHDATMPLPQDLSGGMGFLSGNHAIPAQFTEDFSYTPSGIMQDNNTDVINFGEYTKY